jgi:hypothetical protein
MPCGAWEGTGMVIISLTECLCCGQGAGTGRAKRLGSGDYGHAFGERNVT